MSKYTYIVTTEYNDEILMDVLLKLGFGKKLIRRLKGTGGIFVNDKSFRMIDKVYEKDVITVDWDIAEKENKPLIPNKSLNLKTVYEDSDYVVFEKPYNLSIHPCARYLDTSVGNYFSYLYPDRPFRPIGRLDKDTTGLSLIAKNELAAAITNGNVTKKYYAIIEGILDNKRGTINAPIYRPNHEDIIRVVDEKGETAITNYEVIKEINNMSLVECSLITGRTHQIRVHFSYIGHPLIGDALYNGKPLIKRQALHLGYIKFTNPAKDKEIIIKSPLPEDMKNLLEVSYERSIC